MFILFLVIGSDAVGYGMSFPLFAILFGSKANPFYVGSHLNIEYLFIYFGIFISIYNLGQLVANPVLGALSDSVGRKPVLAYSLFGTLVSRCLLLYSLLQMNIYLLFFSRFLDGATGGIMSLVNASVMDTSEEKDRVKYMSWVSSSFILAGFVIGPLFFTLFSSFSSFYAIIGPVMLSIFCSLIALFVTLVFFPETLAKEKIHAVPSVKVLLSKLVHSLDNLKLIAQEKSFRPLFLAYGFMYFSFTVYSNFSSQFLASFRNFSQGELGIYYFVNGACIFLFETLVAYKILNKYKINEKILYLASLVGLFVVSFSLAPSFKFIIANTAISMFFVTLLIAYARSQVAKVKSEHKGAIMGTFSSVQVLAMAIAPVVGGLVSNISVRLPFFLAAILFTITGFLFRRANKNVL